MNSTDFLESTIIRATRSTSHKNVSEKDAHFEKQDRLFSESGSHF